MPPQDANPTPSFGGFGLKPPVGAVLHIERTTPVVLETYNDLG